MKNLRFSHFVWKDGDGNCCPSGGTITIDFLLENDELRVKSYRYDKED